MRIRIALAAAFAATAVLILCAATLSGATAPTSRVHRRSGHSGRRLTAAAPVPATTLLADLLSASAPPPPPPLPLPPPSSPVPATDATSTNTADWQCIRVHESGDAYNDPSRPSGAYGIELVTWESNGYSGWPYEAAPAVQDALALKLYNEYGWVPWSTRFACGLGG